MKNNLFRKSSATGENALVCEAQGLEALREALSAAGVTDVRVPVIHSLTADGLVMDRVTEASTTPFTQCALGRGLALMHRQPQAHYGWSRDNWIGLNPQPNRWSGDWGDFFVRHRLGYQIGLIRDQRVQDEFREVLDQQKDSLAEWLTAHCDGASLVHGDLWAGNALFSDDAAWLIDPAVYCADREVDIAMTEMFGGFPASFYDAYDAVLPRTDAYRSKRTVYNLYHCLNHYNLFGNAYLAACRERLAALPGISR